MKINLNDCVAGDKVVTVHGWPCVLAWGTAGKTLWRIER
jgi:hypothetical protein